MPKNTMQAPRNAAGSATSKPIFIVGMNGSGTTLMLNCLNAHSELYGFPRETLVIPHYIHRLSDYGDLNKTENFKSLWDDFRGESHFCWVNEGEIPPLPNDWRELPHSFSTVINETFGYFTHKEDKRRWCEKTPMHAQHITELHALFPDACFIHMIRDGRSCAASFHRRWGYIPERTIYRWRNVIGAARRQAKVCNARYIEIFYEKLTENPTTEMRRVCDFIGVKFDEAVLAPSRKPKHMGSTANTITQSAPRWCTHFNDHRLGALERIAGRTLSQLGYSVSQRKLDHNPSPLVLRSWAFRDNARRAIRIIQEQLSTPKNKRWDSLGGRIRRAILQKLNSRF